MNVIVRNFYIIDKSRISQCFNKFHLRTTDAIVFQTHLCLIFFTL